MAARESDATHSSAATTTTTTSSAAVVAAPLAAPSAEPTVTAAMTLAAVGQALQDAAQLAAKYGTTAAARERLEHLEGENEALSDMVAVLRSRLRTAQRATATAESDARRHKAALMSSAAEAAAAAQSSSSTAASLSANAQPHASLRFDADAFVEFLKHRFACRGDLTLLLDALVAFQNETTQEQLTSGRYSPASQPQSSERIVLLTIEQVQTSLGSLSLPPAAVNGPYNSSASAQTATVSAATASAAASDGKSASVGNGDRNSDQAPYSAASYYAQQSREEEEQEIHLAAKQLLSPVTFARVTDHDDEDEDEDHGDDGEEHGEEEEAEDHNDSRSAQAPVPQPTTTTALTVRQPTLAPAPSAAAIGAQSIFAPIQQSAEHQHSNSSGAATLTSAALSASSAMAAAAAAFVRAQSSVSSADDDTSKLKRILPKKPRIKLPLPKLGPLIAPAPSKERQASPVLAPTASTPPPPSASVDATAQDEPAAAATGTAVKTSKKRKVTTDEGLVIKQNLVWPTERRNITEMKHSSRLLELDALAELDRQTPWNEMYKRRPLYSHVINYSALDERAKTWFVTTLKIQFVWRRELWERLHWLPMSESVCTGAAWEKYRQTRKRRAKHAVTAWRKVYAQSIQMIEAGILPDDVWCDPALWYMPANPIYWLPDSADVVTELALIDNKHAVRCYHVYDLTRHPFYELGLVDKYPTKHELPSISTTTAMVLPPTAAASPDDDFALSSVPLLADLAPRQSPHMPKVLVPKDGAKKRAPRSSKKSSSRVVGPLPRLAPSGGLDPLAAAKIATTAAAAAAAGLETLREATGAL